MNSACPYCFTRLGREEVVYRCTSGRCQPAPDPQATALAGYEVATTRMYRQVLSETVKTLPADLPCGLCGGTCTQEVCPACHRDLPEQWRNRRVFTMARAGARGSGKSVYIAVAVETLIRYAQARGRTVGPETTGTQEVYSSRYYKPLYQENKVVEGTPPIAAGGAYQRDPLIWSVVGGPERLSIVMRDLSGEDVEKLAGVRPNFSFIDRADLVVFLFDPLMLESVRQVLAGVIPDVDAHRLGARPGEVLPRILAQTGSGTARLALVISKFDSLHQLPRVSDSRAAILANPAAHFNQDATMRRTALAPDLAAAQFEADSRFLDAEVRALFDRINEESVTLVADQAARDGRIAAVRHFAVSAVGESPLHANQLTQRGISPFRVLDPILWGLSAKGVEL
jgi:hypothetical protein